MRSVAILVLAWGWAEEGKRGTDYSHVVECERARGPRFQVTTLSSMFPLARFCDDDLHHPHTQYQQCSEEGGAEEVERTLVPSSVVTMNCSVLYLSHHTPSVLVRTGGRGGVVLLESGQDASLQGYVV
jgi:hypothetical protein